MPPSPSPKRNEGSVDRSISMSNYGSVGVDGGGGGGEQEQRPLASAEKQHHSSLNSFASLKDVGEYIFEVECARDVKREEDTMAN